MIEERPDLTRRLFFALAAHLTHRMLVERDAKLTRTSARGVGALPEDPMAAPNHLLGVDASFSRRRGNSQLLGGARSLVLTSRMCVAAIVRRWLLACEGMSGHASSLEGAHAVLLGESLWHALPCH